MYGDIEGIIGVALPEIEQLGLLDCDSGSETEESDVPTTIA